MKQTYDTIGLVANSIINILKNIFGGDYTDVSKIHLYYHYAESVLISLLNANRLEILRSDVDYLAALNQMVELRLLSAEIMIFFKEHKTIIEDNLKFHDGMEWCNPQYIHERLLSYELNISEKDIWFSSDKVSRNNTGSYYTPSNLAREVVREAIKKYLKVNGLNTKAEAAKVLAETKFADLSCGCGEFIRAVWMYLHERYNIESEKICLNLYGVDIDPIALQITICSLLEIAPKNNWPTIVGHFVLGNPLIDTPNAADFAEKTRLFATKRYYALGMGIDMRCLFANAHINIVIGNPPWEKVRFEERKFFRSFMPRISAISQKNKRKAVIDQIKVQTPICFNWYRQIVDDYNNFKTVVKRNPFLSKSLEGELNTYSMFTELSLNIIVDNGVLTLIVKSAISTSPANKSLFTHLTKNLDSICFYNNTFRIFDIDSRERFCVITCTKKVNSSFELIAGASKIEDLHSMERISLTVEDIRVINPYTHMLPNISRNSDIQILMAAHKRLPLFNAVYPDCRYGRLVHLTSHADYIDTVPTNDNVPIYEGKFIERYDARFATFAGVPETKKYSAKAYARKNLLVHGKKALPECRYFIKKDFWDKLSSNYSEPYMLCWRSLTSPTNARTTLAMLLPTMPTCQSIQFLQTKSKTDLLIILALFNSKPFDYLVRLKMPGIDLTQSVIRQIPVPRRDIYQQRILYSNVKLPLERHIIERVSAILLHEPMVSSILTGLLPPSADVQKKSKLTIENELDELFFIAYGFSDSECQEIQNSFIK